MSQFKTVHFLQKQCKHLINICCTQKFNVSTWTPLATAFNSRPGTKLNLSFTRDDVGLFGLQELRNREGFYLLKESAINISEMLVEESCNKNRKRKMVEIFDELSDSLCRVADLAEFIRIAHPQGSFSQAAENVCVSISGIVEKLNTNKELYLELKKVAESGDIMETTEVDRHVAKLFMFDFEQCGIHLPDAERQEVVELNDYILQLGQRFMAGAVSPRAVFRDALPKDIRNMFSADGDKVIVSGLSADSPNEMAREVAYKIYLHPDKHQDYLLTEMLQARYKLATICGFPTYAHRALKSSIVEEPGIVSEFLDTVSDKLRSKAEADFKQMAYMKTMENLHAAPLAPWDVPYLTNKAKKDWLQAESTEFSPYFSLGGCMEGLNFLFSSLYGIHLQHDRVEPGELWAPDVYKVSVIHEKEGLLGYIYCDFYERANKPNQDCHFTIRGGKRLSDGSGVCFCGGRLVLTSSSGRECQCLSGFVVLGSTGKSSKVIQVLPQTPDWENPVVVLMLNLPTPRWSGPSLLTPSMVDNLFHEMGHAMHSMLARTEYQHVTGTRCSTDFAEVPSVLMEYFASDPRVVRCFAKHFMTKEPMPEEMLNRLCASKHLFSASEMQVQVFYSALDQVYHGKFPLEGTTTEVLAQMQKKYYGIPYVPNTAWQLRFSHLVGYGAKYYSYLLSRAVASWIWQSCFQDNPLSRKQGEKYRRHCLAHGGGKPAKALVADFLEREVTPDNLSSALIQDLEMQKRN